MSPSSSSSSPLQKVQLTNNIAVTSLIGLLGIIIVFIYNTAFSKGFFTCNRYILNTYLYILMAFVLISLEVLAFDLNQVDILQYFGSIGSFIITLIIVIGILIVTMSINPRNVLLKHISWLVFVGILGILVYPAYLRSKDKNTLLPVLLSLTAILVIFSLVAFVRPDLISFSWGPILMFLLIGVIITHLIFLATINKRSNNQNMKFVKGVSYFIIVLFIFFVMYDTKKIIVAAKQCKEMTADYINQSLGIIIDAVNLFQSLVNVTN